MIDEKTTVRDGQEPAVEDAPPPAGGRNRRRRILAVGLAAATVAAGVVVWSTAGGAAPAAADRADGGTGRSGGSAASATTDPASTEAAEASPKEDSTTSGDAPGATPSTAPTAAESAGPTAAEPDPAPGPAGWEPRTFEGVTFAVPPGAVMPDVTDPGNADAPALFSWNGPDLGNDVYAQISMWFYPADGAPELPPDYQAIDVPGAESARMWTGPAGVEPATVVVDVHMLAGGRFINLVATFAAGPEGEQMVRDLVASVSIG